MTIQRFNGADSWAVLTPKQRDAVGAAALEYAAGFIASEETDNDVIERATAANDARLAAELFDTVKASLPGLKFCDAVPSRIGGVCRKCGCTEYDACEGGCSWVEPDLCSACKP